MNWRDLEVGFDDQMRVCIRVKGNTDPKFIEHMVRLGFAEGKENDVIVGAATIDGVAKKLPPEPPPPVLGKNASDDVNVDRNVRWICGPLGKAFGDEIGELEDRLKKLKDVNKIFVTEVPQPTAGGNGDNR